MTSSGSTCSHFPCFQGSGSPSRPLIGELAYGSDSLRDEHVKIGVLVVGSLVAALIGATLLRARNGTYRRICEDEEVDADGDGVPDIFDQKP